MTSYKWSKETVKLGPRDEGEQVRAREVGAEDGFAGVDRGRVAPEENFKIEN